MDRIILTDESLNSYGFRVLTSGAVLDRFMKNPVLLYDHNSWGLPIGKWKGLSVEGDRITAEPDFDMEDEDAKKVAGKYERGFLSAASIGFQILATSEAPEDMLPGQTLPTVTKWEMYEASLTPIPANGNAIRLYDHEGKEVDLNDSAAVQLALHPQTQIKVKEKDTEKLSFDQKALLWLFGKLGVKPPEEAEAQAEAPEAPAAPGMSHLAAQLEELTAELSTSMNEITQLKATHQAALELRDARIAELEAEVKKLSQQDADEEAEGRSEADHKDTPGEVLLPETLAAIEHFSKLKTHSKK